MKQLLPALLLGGLAATVAGATEEFAADDLRAEKLADLPLWELRFAGFGRYGQSYPASEESQTDIVPLPFPIYRGQFLRIGDDTDKPVRTRLFRRDRVKIDLDFGLNFPVDSDDVDARTGMPDLDLLAEVGPELELQFIRGLMGGETFLALQARGAWSFDGLDPDWRGAVLSVELKHKLPIFTPKTELLTRVTPEFASQDYMDFFYGVDAAYATLARPAYKAESGYLGTRLSLVLKHEFSPTVEFRSGLKFGFYQGAANDNSPLFTDKTTSGFFAAVLWKFWESKRRANR